MPGWRRRRWVTEHAARSLGLWVGLERRLVCTDEGRLHSATLSLLSLLSVLVGFGEGPECLKNFTKGGVASGMGACCPTRPAVGW